jgi:hypothetical protein
MMSVSILVQTCSPVGHQGVDSYLQVFGIIKDTKLLAVEFTSCINVLMPLSMVV